MVEGRELVLFPKNMVGCKLLKWIKAAKQKAVLQYKKYGIEREGNREFTTDGFLFVPALLPVTIIQDNVPFQYFVAYPITDRVYLPYIEK